MLKKFYLLFCLPFFVYSASPNPDDWNLPNPDGYYPDQIERQQIPSSPWVDKYVSDILNAENQLVEGNFPRSRGNPGRYGRKPSFLSDDFFKEDFDEASLDGNNSVPGNFNGKIRNPRTKPVGNFPRSSGKPKISNNSFVSPDSSRDDDDDDRVVLSGDDIVRSKTPLVAVQLITMESLRKYFIEGKDNRKKGNSYMCSKCKKSSKSLQHLVDHVHQHTAGESPSEVTCVSCPEYGGSQPKNFYKHVHKIHPDKTKEYMKDFSSVFAQVRKDSGYNDMKINKKGGTEGCGKYQRNFRKDRNLCIDDE